MATKNEIESLIYLLDDPNPEIQSSVHNRFRELGENAVPLLDQFKTESKNDDERELINDIIHTITFGTLYEDFSDLLENGVTNRHQLEVASFMLARFGNPTLRTEEYQRKLDQFANDIYNEITYRTSENQQMHFLLRHVFRELRFHGDDKDYHNPENAYLDRVIDRRKGLPISLSLIVIFLARRLDLPFYGVNMPIHFMLVFEGVKQNILIDPFDGGTIVSYDQCHYFLKKNGVDPRPEHMQRTSELEVLARSIRNLMHSYSKAGKKEKVRDLQSLLQLIEIKT
jgi:regulator of sirC expression with transglutaminase-like and TPR domain